MSHSLFDSEERPALAARLAPVLRSWAERGVYFGCSSWKYPGWLGTVYTENRYFTRNKFSKAKFEANCLGEYAETFPAVGGDFSFYQFPAPNTWAKVFAGTPPDFGFGFKVPEAVTVNWWPLHARYGLRAGLKNESFLDAELFKAAFIEPLEKHGNHVAVLIFEFGTFGKKDFASPSDFLNLLNGFLGSLPNGWRYAVEIRNKDYLGPEYFETLAKHNVAHVFNAWTRMPTLTDQIAMDAFTADHTVVRALLQHGRSYEQAVKLFEPYDKIQQPDPATREALRQIAERTVKKKKRAYIFINNRLEGSSPKTIEAVVSEGT
jgi:uncharacterized protein YecE (DUF72 family)